MLKTRKLQPLDSRRELAVAAKKAAKLHSVIVNGTIIYQGDNRQFARQLFDAEESKETTKSITLRIF